MKKPLALIAAFLGVAMLLSGCSNESSNRQSESVVSGQSPFNENAPRTAPPIAFRPNQNPYAPETSTCKKDLSSLSRAEVGFCVYAVAVAMDADEEWNAPPTDQETPSSEEYKNSPCLPDLTQLGSADLGRCFKLVGEMSLGIN